MRFQFRIANLVTDGGCLESTMLTDIDGYRRILTDTDGFVSRHSQGLLTDTDGSATELLQDYSDGPAIVFLLSASLGDVHLHLL